MGYTDYFHHKYKVSKVSPVNGSELHSTIVTGSKAAFEEQQRLEEQGFHVAVFNMNRGVEEYRTGEDN